MQNDKEEKPSGVTYLQFQIQIRFSADCVFSAGSALFKSQDFNFIGPFDVLRLY